VTKRLLITGFGPFPKVPVNPTERLAQTLVESLSSTPDLDVACRILPTTWAMLDAFDGMLDETRPDAILAFGVARKRRVVTPERFGRNRRTTARKDAAGVLAETGPLMLNGPEQIVSKVDVKAVAAAMRGAGCAARVSLSAGAYLCNALTYRLYRLPQPSLFVHIPLPAEFGEGPPGRPSFEEMLSGARAALPLIG
jgi:pyroglutamyl-peptidase